MLITLKGPTNTVKGTLQSEKLSTSTCYIPMSKYVPTVMSSSFHVAFISGCFLKLIQLQFFSNLSVGLVPIPGFSPAISRLSTLMLPKWLAMHHRIREHLKWGFILQQNAEQLPCLTILLNTAFLTEFHSNIVGLLA